MFFFFPLALPQRHLHDPPSMRLPSPHWKFLQRLLFSLHYITTATAAAASTDNVSCINNNNSKHVASTYSVLDAMLSDLLWGLLKVGNPYDVNTVTLLHLVGEQSVRGTRSQVYQPLKPKLLPTYLRLQFVKLFG